MKKQSFIQGVVLLTAAGMAVKVLGFLYRVVLTNLPGYGDIGNGIYGAGFQVYLILFTLSTTGFPSAISKMVAERMAVGNWKSAHKVFKVSFYVLFAFGIIISSLFFISSRQIAKIISNPQVVYTMMALSPTIFFVCVMSAYRGYFQGMNDITPQAGSQVVEQAVKTIFTVFLAYLLLPYGVEWAAAGATFGTTIGACIGTIYLWRLYNRRKQDLWKNIRNFHRQGGAETWIEIMKNLFKLAVPISVGAVVLTVSSIIDLTTVMRSLIDAGFSVDDANRLYGILTGKCYVLTHFPITINVALATLLVPSIASSMAIRDMRTVSRKISMSLKLTTLIGVPASVGMAVLAHPILMLLFPNNSDGAYFLALSASTIVFIGLTETLAGILQGLGKVSIPAISLFFGAVVKLIINYSTVSIPEVNLKGAIVGTLVCYVVSSITGYIYLIRKFKLKINLRDFIIKPMVASSAMGIFAYYGYDYFARVSQSNLISMAATIVLSVLVYSIIILLLGGVSRREIELVPFGQNIGQILAKVKLVR